jgi:hypothetical protein
MKLLYNLLCIKDSSTGIILVWYGSEDINYKTLLIPQLNYFIKDSIHKISNFEIISFGYLL